MLKKSLRNKSVKSISALLSASALAMGLGLSQPAQAADPFIGQIVIFGGNFAPRGWATCSGQLLPISQNTALFSLLGTIYGGDGETTFALPDLRGRAAIGSGSGPGLTPRPLGQRGGAQSVFLSVNQLPSHSHVATATLHGTDTRGNSAVPTGNILASKPRTNIYSDTAPDVIMNLASVTVTVGNTGGNQGVPIMQPYLAVNYIIALQGVFPSQ